MKHLATSRFWRCYHALPAEVRKLADRNFAQLKADANHPSLHFKKVGTFCFGAQQPVVKVGRRTEPGDAPEWQGATRLRKATARSRRSPRSGRRRTSEKRD